MLSQLIDQDVKHLLNAALKMDLIHDWREHGKYVVVTRSDANFYVEPATIERLLKQFCAEC